MSFAQRLQDKRPRTASDYYDAWFNELPDDERQHVKTALADRVNWTHPELKSILESDPDNPAPKFGATAFRQWRSELTA